MAEIVRFEMEGKLEKKWKKVDTTGKDEEKTV